jgi:hypothetical protein
MSAFSCVACGAEKSPCCDVAGGAKQACQDGQKCGADKMCPAAIPSGWAGEPCGTGDKKCNGKLDCNAASQTCECNAAAEWTVCSGDNTKVCAPGSGPTPGPPSTCPNWPQSAAFKPANANDVLCKLFVGNCADGDTVCAAGQFHVTKVKGAQSRSCANQTQDGQKALMSAFQGSTDPTQTSFCYRAK